MRDCGCISAGMIKHMFVPKNYQARTAMYKFIDAGNLDGIQRMINKGTLILIQ